MNEALLKFLSDLRSAWRFRWQALAIAWAVCLLGWVVVFALPDEYEAEARFFVDTTTRLDEVISGITVQADESSQIALVRQAMLSRPSLEAVARDTDLDLLAQSPAELERLVLRLASKISVSNVAMQGRSAAGDGIFRITFRYPDRQKAYAVVDTMLDNFREDVVSGRSQGTVETLKFLESEIAQYQAQLQDKEREIAEFKSRNVGLLPGQTGGYFDILQDKLASVRRLEAEYSVLMDRKSALLKQVRGEQPMLSEGDGSGIANPQNELEARISDLESSIEEMLTRYTDKWPDVIAARDQLDQLYKRREQELAELADSDPDSMAVPSNNPVYQQLRIAINETDIEIAEVERRIAALRTEIGELEQRVDVVPEVETGLASLTRDLEQLRTVYASLRQRLQQEELRQKRLGWGGVTFRVIDPPRVSLEPVAPLRMELILLVLFAGLAAGAGFAYLVQMLNPVFFDRRSLTELTGMPVLGTVRMAWQTEHRARRKRELVALGAAAAMIVVAATLALFFLDAGVHLGAELRELVAL